MSELWLLLALPPVGLLLYRWGFRHGVRAQRRAVLMAIINSATEMSAGTHEKGSPLDVRLSGNAIDFTKRLREAQERTRRLRPPEGS